jgi:hypothetical protein
LILLTALAAAAQAQQSAHAPKPLPSDANQFVRELIQNELKAQEDDRTRWMYRLHREDDKNIQDRLVIETARGNISRTLVLNGHLLTAEERARDDARMKNLAGDPQEQARREKRERDDAQQAQELFKAFPDAFLYQYDGEEDGLVRLTFTHNPRYSPPNRKLTVFHSLNGRMWVDRTAMRLARIEGQLFEDVNFFLGLGHLDKGGTFKVMQKDVGDGHWEIVFMDVSMRGRAVFFKSINVRQKQVLDNFQRVRDDLTFPQAYEMLLKIPLPQSVSEK